MEKRVAHWLRSPSVPGMVVVVGGTQNGVSHSERFEGLTLLHAQDDHGRQGNRFHTPYES